MTVTYTFDVGNAGVKTLRKLLFRWKGSVWKAVYPELILWLSAYGTLSVIYNNALSPEQQRTFEQVCEYFRKYEEFLPVTFLLGFFVSVVINRWWTMFENIGWIDSVAFYIANNVRGGDEEGRLLRRNILRNLLFHQVLVYRDISVCIRERFPTLESFVAAGYITEDELQIFYAINSKFPQYWVPIAWTMNNIRRAYREGRIYTPQALQDLQAQVMLFRGCHGTLLGFDWVPVPLVYSQVVAISVRLFFILALLGRQNIKFATNPNFVDPIDLYIPIMSTCQFIFYVGWLKVAEALLNPFGKDDDDLEINWLLDRNLEVGYMIIEEREELPLIRDAFWDIHGACPMYSADTAFAPYNVVMGSASYMKPRPSVPMMPPHSDDPTIDIERTGSTISQLSRIPSNLFRRVFGSRNAVYPDSQNDISTTTEIEKVPPQLRRHSVPRASQVRRNSYNSGAGELHIVMEEDENSPTRRKKSRFHISSRNSDDVQRMSENEKNSEIAEKHDIIRETFPSISEDRDLDHDLK